MKDNKELIKFKENLMKLAQSNLIRLDTKEKILKNAVKIQVLISKNSATIVKSK